MSMFNNIRIKGNIANDIELRSVKIKDKDVAVANFGVIVNEGEKKTYFPIVAWGKNAENAKKYLSKGRDLDIEGRAEFREETLTLKDGSSVNRHNFSLVAETLVYGKIASKESQGVANEQAAAPNVENESEMDE